MSAKFELTAQDRKRIMAFTVELLAAGPVKKASLFKKLSVPVGKPDSGDFHQAAGVCLNWLSEAGYVLISGKTCSLSANGKDLTKGGKLKVTPEELVQKIVDRTPKLATEYPGWAEMLVPDHSGSEDRWAVNVLSGFTSGEQLTLSQVMAYVSGKMPPQAVSAKADINHKVQVTVNTLVSSGHLAEKKKNQGPYTITPSGKAYLKKQMKALAAAPAAPAPKPDGKKAETFHLGFQTELELRILMTLKQYPGSTHKELNGRLYEGVKATNKEKQKQVVFSDNLFRELIKNGFIRENKGWYYVSKQGETRMKELQKHSLTAGSVVPVEQVTIEEGVTIPRLQFIQDICEAARNTNGVSHTEINDLLKEKYHLTKKVKLSAAVARELLHLSTNGKLDKSEGSRYRLHITPELPESKNTELPPVSESETLVRSLLEKFLNRKTWQTEIRVSGLMAEELASRMVPVSEIKRILADMAQAGTVLSSKNSTGQTVYMLPKKSAAAKKPENPPEEVLEPETTPKPEAQGSPIIWDTVLELGKKLLDRLPASRKSMLDDEMCRNDQGGCSQAMEMLEQAGLAKRNEDMLDITELGAFYRNMRKPDLERAKAICIIQYLLSDRKYAKTIDDIVVHTQMPKQMVEGTVKRMRELDMLENLKNGEELTRWFFRDLQTQQSAEAAVELVESDTQNRKALLNRIRAMIIFWLPHDRAFIDEELLEEFGPECNAEMAQDGNLFDDLYKSLEQDGFLTMKHDEADTVELTKLGEAWLHEWCGSNTLPIRGNDTPSFEAVALLALECLAVEQTWYGRPLDEHQLRLYMTNRLPARFDYLSHDIVHDVIRSLKAMEMLQYEETNGVFSNLELTVEAEEIGKALSQSRLLPEEKLDERTLKVRHAASPFLENKLNRALAMDLYQGTACTQEELVSELGNRYPPEDINAAIKKLMDEHYIGWKYDKQRPQQELTLTYKGCAGLMLYRLTNGTGSLEPVPETMELSEKERDIMRDSILLTLFNKQPQTKETLLPHLAQSMPSSWMATEENFASVTYRMRRGSFDHRLVTRTDDTKEFTLAAGGYGRLMQELLCSIPFAIKIDRVKPIFEKQYLLDMKQRLEAPGSLVRTAVLNAMADNCQEKGMAIERNALEEAVTSFLNYFGYWLPDGALDACLSTMSTTGILVQAENLFVEHGPIYSFSKKTMAELPKWYDQALRAALDLKLPTNNKAAIMYLFIQHLLENGGETCVMSEINGMDIIRKLPVDGMTSTDELKAHINTIIYARGKLIHMNFANFDGERTWLTYDGILLARELGLIPELGIAEEPVIIDLSRILYSFKGAVPFDRISFRWQKAKSVDASCEPELMESLRQLADKGFAVYNEDAATWQLTRNGVLLSGGSIPDIPEDNRDIQLSILRSLFWEHDGWAKMNDLKEFSGDGQTIAAHVLCDNVESIELAGYVTVDKAAAAARNAAAVYNEADVVITDKGKQLVLNLTLLNKRMRSVMLQVVSLTGPIMEDRLLDIIFDWGFRSGQDFDEYDVRDNLETLINKQLLYRRPDSLGQSLVGVTAEGQAKAVYLGPCDVLRYMELERSPEPKEWSEAADKAIQSALGIPAAAPVSEDTTEPEPVPEPASEPAMELEVDDTLCQLYTPIILDVLYKLKKDWPNLVFMPFRDLYQNTQEALALKLGLPVGSAIHPDTVVRSVLNRMAEDGQVLEQDNTYQITADGAIAYLGKGPAEPQEPESDHVEFKTENVVGWFALRKVPQPMVVAITSNEMLKLHNQKYSLQSHWTFQPNELEKAQKWAGVTTVYAGDPKADYHDPVELLPDGNRRPMSVLDQYNASPSSYSTIWVYTVRILAEKLPLRFDVLVDRLLVKLGLSEDWRGKIGGRASWVLSYMVKAGWAEHGNEDGRTYIMTGNGQLAFPDLSDNGIVSVLSDYPFFQNVASDLISCVHHEKSSPDGSVLAQELEAEDMAFKARLLSKMQHMDPLDFEILILRLIKAMGYGEMVPNQIDPNIPGDEGVDGMIRCDELGFRSIYTQAKRWSSTMQVGRPEVQKFVGALEGKNCTEGIFITTTKFSDAAIEFAQNLARFKVVLVDGSRLTDLMLKYKLGFIERPSYCYREFDNNWWNSLKDEY